MDLVAMALTCVFAHVMTMAQSHIAGTGTSPADSRPVHVLNTLLKCIGMPDDQAFVSDQKKGFVNGLLA